MKKKPNELVLKELPKDLKYSFLGRNETKKVIISSQMDNGMEVKLLGVFEKNSKAFGLSIDDIKGISSSIRMHKILMDKIMLHPLNIKGG